MSQESLLADISISTVDEMLVEGVGEGKREGQGRRRGGAREG